MRLPYRQMSDEDIMNLEIEKLTKNGVIFLWVTSRVFSIGVKCLEKWGYVLPSPSQLIAPTNHLLNQLQTHRHDPLGEDQPARRNNRDRPYRPLA
jgi:hypothetical protein